MRRALGRTVIHLGGRFVEEGRATVSLLDAGYLLGDGVFETMRGYRGRVFRKEAHFDQLVRAAEMLGIAIPLAREEIVELSDEAARRTDADEAYVRLTLTRGAPGAGPTFSILARPLLDAPPEEDYARGIDAVVVEWRRIPPACIDTTVKTTSYAPQVLARREVARQGAAEGIVLALDGSVACGTMANVFVVEGTKLLTPPLATGCRAGITRAFVLEQAAKIGLAAVEATIAPKMLLTADEVFFTSTRVECIPVASIDGQRLRATTYRAAHGLRAALREEALA